MVFFTVDSFNPYYTWLGIPLAEQPANHYRLLGISLFEDNPDVIENAADRQSSHVAGRSIGPRSAISQRILNELARAKLCLLDPRQKAEYDQSLRQARNQALSAPLSPAAPAPTPQLADTSIEPHRQAEPGSPVTGTQVMTKPIGSDRSMRQRLGSWGRSRRRGVYLALSIVGGGAIGIVIAISILPYLRPEAKRVAEWTNTKSTATKKTVADDDPSPSPTPSATPETPSAIPGPSAEIPPDHNASLPKLPPPARPSGFAPIPSVRSPASGPRESKSVTSQPEPAAAIATPATPTAPTPFPKPGPSELPVAVDLPVAEESQAQPLFSIPDSGSPLSLQLDCSLAALPEGMRVTLEEDPAGERREWQIKARPSAANEACAAAQSVGVLTCFDSKLQLRWTPGADANVVNQMRNCVLAVGDSAETHYVPLRTPVKVKPILLVMPEGTKAHTFQIDYAPRMDSLQVELGIVPSNSESRASLDIGKSTELALDEKLQASVSNRMSEAGLLSISCGLSSEDQEGFLSLAKVEEMGKRISTGITNATRSYERARQEAIQAQNRINDRRTNSARRALDRGILATKQKAMATIEKNVARMQAELKQLEDLRNRVASRERISYVHFRLIARSETCELVLLEALN